ncbi:hypothetical protein GCM10011445_13720 [Pseudocitrobacter faecalis]|nr:hypothetical protein GCM10011445_13720 [Pseudocitrobacter faecalis]
MCMRIKRKDGVDREEYGVILSTNAWAFITIVSAESHRLFTATACYWRHL